MPAIMSTGLGIRMLTTSDVHACRAGGSGMRDLPSATHLNCHMG